MRIVQISALVLVCVAAYAAMGARAWFDDGCGLPAGPPVAGPVSSVLHARSGQLVVMTEGGELFASDRVGGSWTRRERLAPGGPLVDLDGDTLLAESWWTMSSRGLFASNDLGRSWRTVSCSIAVAASDPTNPRVGYFVVIPRVDSSRDGSVYRTTDNGRQWTRLAGPGRRGEQTILNVVAVSPVTGEVWVAPEFGGVYVSADRGENWRFEAIPPVRLGLFGQQVHDIAFAGSSGVVWVGSRLDGLFRRDRSGRWRRAGFARHSIGEVAVSSGARETVIANVGDGLHPRFMRTSDAGRSWSRVRGLPRGICCVVADRRGRFLAWTQDRVFLSSDGGRCGRHGPPFLTADRPQRPCGAPKPTGAENRTLQRARAV